MNQIDPIFNDVDIVKKYHKYPEFKKELDDIFATYQDLVNMALYANLGKQ